MGRQKKKKTIVEDDSLTDENSWSESKSKTRARSDALKKIIRYCKDNG